MTDILNSELFMVLADGGFFYAIFFIAAATISVVGYDFVAARANMADMAATAKTSALVTICVGSLTTWYVVNIQYGTLAYLLVMLPEDLRIIALIGSFIPSGLQAYYILVEEYDGQNKIKEFAVSMIDVVANVMGMLSVAGVHPVDVLDYAIANPLQVLTMTLLSLVGNYLIENLGIRAIVRNSLVGAKLKNFAAPKTIKLPETIKAEKAARRRIKRRA